MKFCPVVPEICRGQVHGPRKDRRKRRKRKRKRNGAKTINYYFAHKNPIADFV
jgi:hypothetical protein